MKKHYKDEGIGELLDDSALSDAAQLQIVFPGRIKELDDYSEIRKWYMEVMNTARINSQFDLLAFSAFNLAIIESDGIKITENGLELLGRQEQYIGKSI